MTHEPWTDSPNDPKRMPHCRAWQCPYYDGEHCRGCRHVVAERPIFTRPSPWPRRLILAALVFAALVAGGFLSGCASFTTTQRASDYGGANIQWAFGQTFPDGRCGEVIALDGGAYIMRFAGPAPTFRDSLECLGHELLHVMGGGHE